MADSKYIKCSVDGCENNSHRSGRGRAGMCRIHYYRKCKYGSPLAGGVFNGEPEKWLRSIVANPPKGCAIWPYGKTGKTGYGILTIDSVRVHAHRTALIWYTKSAPEGMHAIHGHCHNPSCCNPLHLSWGTHDANMLDKLRDGTDNRGEKHPLAKLTESQVIKIRKDTRTNSIIASEYGVHRLTISMIKRRINWAWLE